MAQISHHTFNWAGQNFSPGAEMGWWFGPVAANEVVHATAIPATENDNELLVKDARVRRYLGLHGWRFLFTVRNTGPHVIPSYAVLFSVVKP